MFDKKAKVNEKRYTYMTHLKMYLGIIFSTYSSSFAAKPFTKILLNLNGAKVSILDV